MRARNGPIMGRSLAYKTEADVHHLKLEGY